MPRIQSPSSINTFRQCPRKYYYQYIKKLATGTNIHLIRGKAVHSVLENFFEVNIENIHEDNFEFELKTLLFDMFRQEWEKAKSELETINMSKHNQIFYYNESKKMLDNWFKCFSEKLKEQMDSKSLVEAFNFLTPITERQYRSETHKVRGFIDAIHEFPDGVHILDYKTSSRDKMSADYRLQLGIYAMMYHQKHGVKPKKVGINFLRFGERYLEVDEDLIKEAERECLFIQEQTQTDDKEHYNKKPGPLCKWSTGQCDFYEHCIKDD